MNAKDTIRETLNLSTHVLKSYFSDLDDAELMLRPGPGCNHLAWQLGHLITSQCGLLNAIRPGSAPELPAGFAENHDRKNVGSDDAAQFGTTQQYLDLLDRVNAATLAVLEDYPEPDFSKESPEVMRQRFPTIGSLFVLIATHPMMHAGQFVPVRRALGKPVVI
jgi:hypothetical protein